MRIRWSPDAVADLENIVAYIHRDNPAAAQRVGQAIYDRLSVLGTFPYGGRVGCVEGTREFPLPPPPFIVVYRVLQQADVVQIVNVIHGAERWPPAD
ncbi:MAG TPA: type II toxin-antitoxin system RelE/ParE family toxin [Bryobacteraceae bacterium]|nr:type II toxin-antitoxin system RelE/ParE family toxin [Bryobacteraceae bacterium]